MMNTSHVFTLFWHPWYVTKQGSQRANEPTFGINLRLSGLNDILLPQASHMYLIKNKKEIIFCFPKYPCVY